MHIVIIDDEAAVAETLAEAVRGQGHTAAVGRSGPRAWPCSPRRRRTPCSWIWSCPG